MQQYSSPTPYQWRVDSRRCYFGAPFNYYRTTCSPVPQTLRPVTFSDEPLFSISCVFLFVCYDVCYHYNITGKQLQLWSCNFNIIDGHCSKIMCILFARGQHPAAGCGARFVVPGTTRCYYPSIHPFINTLKAAVIIKYKNTSIIIIVIIKPCRKVVALRDAACFCLSVRLFVCRTKRI